MATAESKSGDGWSDFINMGKFKQITCEPIMDTIICDIRFEEGRVVLPKSDMDKVGVSIFEADGLKEAVNASPFERAFEKK